MNINFLCDKYAVFRELPHLIWEAQSADTTNSILVTRILHNKPLFLGNEFARCYTSYLSPLFLFDQLGLLGFLLLLVGIFFALKNRFYVPLVFLLLTPLAPLFATPSSPSVQAVLLFSSQGFTVAYGVVKLIDFVAERLYHEK